MKENSAINNMGKFHFLDFTFDPVLRTLNRNGEVVQLRKKQSDVLALLCSKYPNPVSQGDFLAEVWNGGYVTPQSIAQSIRSLRVILGDKAKTIIVTIPKLGYQFMVCPCWEESKTDQISFEAHSAVSNERENVIFSVQPLSNFKPISDEKGIFARANLLSRIILRIRGAFSLRVFLVCSLTIIFFVTINAAAYVADFFEKNRDTCL